MGLEKYLTHPNESIREVIKNCLMGKEDFKICKSEYVIDDESSVTVLTDNLYVEGSLVIGSATNLEEIKSKILIIDGNFQLFDCQKLKNLEVENLIVNGNFLIEGLNANYNIKNGSAQLMDIFDCHLNLENIPIISENFTAEFFSMTCCFLSGPFCDESPNLG